MRQGVLFETARLPQGLMLKADFLTLEEERDLLLEFQALSFQEFRMHGVAAKRRIVHFGVRYSAASDRIASAQPIPSFLHAVRERAATLAEIDPQTFEEALVTQYSPGAGIGWHFDSRPFGIVCGISLLGECRMRFQRGLGDHHEVLAVDLPPRSIYILRGSARSEWQHSIPAVKEARYSITFRTLLAHS